MGDMGDTGILRSIGMYARGDSRRDARVLVSVLSATLALACSNGQGSDMTAMNAGAGGDVSGIAGSIGGVAGAGTTGVAGNLAGAAGMHVSGASGAAGTAARGGLSGTAGGAARAGTGAAGRAGTAAGAGGASGAAGSAGASAAGASGGAGSGAYDPCPMTGDCKILPLGDSITYGLGYAGSYRVELFDKAHMAGQHITFVGSLANGPAMVDGVAFPQKNEGHSGWTINQLLPLLPSPALSDMPQIILLMIGTNDIFQNDDLPNAPKRLGGLLDMLITMAPNALIVVGNLTPLSSGSAGVDAYNAAIPAQIDMRKMAGKHVMLVDLHDGFTTAMLADGVHPNKEGSDRMAGVWYKAISNVLH